MGMCIYSQSNTYPALLTIVWGFLSDQKYLTIIYISERPKPKLFRFGFDLVILNETETGVWRIFENFVSEIDFRKNLKF